MEEQKIIRKPQNLEEISYPSELFDDKFLNFFICPICLNFPNPDSAYDHVLCGKIFCTKCCTEWCFKYNKCPTCNTVVSSPIKEFRLIREQAKTVFQIMNSLKIKCPTIVKYQNTKEICGWEGEFSRVQNHLKDCDFQIITCKFGCGRIEQRKILKKHEESECELREVKCEFCKSAIKFKLIQYHLETQCSKCPNTIIACEYTKYGCQLKFKRSEKENHNKENIEMHTALVLSEIKDLKETIDSQEKIIGNKKFDNNFEKLLFPLGSELFIKPHPYVPKHIEISEIYSNELKSHAENIINEIQEDPKQILYFETCRNNHEMLEIIGKMSAICDACGKPIKNNKCRGCLECDFNICLDCTSIHYDFPKIAEPFTYCEICKGQCHILVYNKYNPYTKNFECDVCKKQFLIKDGRYYCAYCGFSVCDNCKKKN